MYLTGVPDASIGIETNVDAKLHNMHLKVKRDALKRAVRCRNDLKNAHVFRVRCVS